MLGHSIASFLTGMEVTIQRAEGPEFTLEQIRQIQGFYHEYLGNAGGEDAYDAETKWLRKEGIYVLRFTMKSKIEANSLYREARKTLCANIKGKVFPGRSVGVAILTKTVDVEYM